MAKKVKSEGSPMTFRPVAPKGASLADRLNYEI